MKGEATMNIKMVIVDEAPVSCSGCDLMGWVCGVPFNDKRFDHSYAVKRHENCPIVTDTRASEVFVGHIQYICQRVRP